MTTTPDHRAAWLVVLAGGVAALQVGKLPPALPALQAELGLTLVQSGFLLSMVQLAGMTDRFALREHERLTGRKLL